ncbi:hypothetical protein ACHQM5_027245 [Ranunculus cassubicifolius]
MAQVSIISKAITAFLMMTILSAITVSAQFDEMAPAPAPTGAAFAMSVSSAVIFSSILVSLFALLRI